jgi:hypothetical protein
MKIINNNPRFGTEGPFDSESFETLADEMAPCFETWADEGSKTVEQLRAEFISGLEEIGD